MAPTGCATFTSDGKKSRTDWPNWISFAPTNVAKGDACKNFRDRADLEAEGWLVA